MDHFTTNWFSSTIQFLLDSQVEFPQKLKQHFVFKSDQVSNPFKFISGLLSKGVLRDGSNDSESNFGLKEMMVRLIIMIACDKGGEGIDGLMEALEESGNLQLITDFKDWIKQDFGTEMESNFGQPEEAVSSAQIKKSQALAAQARKVNEPSSCGAKLVTKIMSRVDDDLMEQLQGHFIGRASEIVNATEFCSSLVDLKVLDEDDMRLGTEPKAHDRKWIETAIKAVSSKKAIGSLVVAFQNSNNERILTETYDWLETSYPRKKNYPISVKSLARQRSGTIWALAIDEASGNLYFAVWESQEIKVCNALGKNSAVVISNSSLVNLPFGLALDSLNGFMYWGNQGSSPHSVLRANLDGSNSMIISASFQRLYGITLDQRSKGVLYWADFGAQAIGIIDVNDGKKRTLVELKNNLRVVGIQVDDDKIYFSTYGNKTIKSFDRNSGEELKTIFKSIGEVGHLALFNELVTQP